MDNQSRVTESVRSENDPLLPRAVIETPSLLPAAPVKRTSARNITTSSAATGKKKRLRGRLQRMISRLRKETKVSYKPYELDFSKRSLSSRPNRPSHSIVNFDEEKQQRAKWKVMERPVQDASLIPTLAVLLWLGSQGIVTLILLHGIIFASNGQRALLLALIVVGLAQPRDRTKRRWSDIALELCIYIIVAGAVYLKSAAVFILGLAIALPLNFLGKVGFRVGNWIASESKKYFALKVTVEDYATLDEISKRGESIIFANEPHDFIALGCFAFHPYLEVLPPGPIRDTMKCLVSSAIMNTPIFRHISWWSCCESVEKANFRRRLSRKQSMVFVPGGVQEVFLMNPSEPEDLVLYLKKRKGFIKLALEHGATIVPTFTFGLDGAYACHIPRGDAINKLSRKIGFLPVVFWGRWYIPFGIPRPKKLHVVIGKPIYIPHIPNAVGKEDIDKYHSIVLEGFEELFERHKGAEDLYCNRNLKIM